MNCIGSGCFRLTNVKSGKVLDVPDESTTDGIALKRWTNHGGDNQAWLPSSMAELVLCTSTAQVPRKTRARASRARGTAHAGASAGRRCARLRIEDIRAPVHFD
ncbi:RICIN domain-containing protein [Sorangium sp. So ce363]|uniref:RICIN domain-containing protein n=1 Tax=Sorangium sp. So ce363 TaxID=3133304 RepID=UPI003F62DD64